MNGGCDVMDQRPDYFPNWPDAERVLSHLVDRILYAEPMGKGIISLRILPGQEINALIPSAFQGIVGIIVNEFLNEVSFYKGLPEVSIPPDPDVGCVLRCLWKRKTPPDDYLKGMLGISPYHLRVPKETHDRILNLIALSRLGIVTDQDKNDENYG